MSKFDDGRNFMKSKVRTNSDYKLDADITKGIPQPLLQEPIKDGTYIVNLPEITVENAPKTDFFESTFNRKSRRNYSEEPLSLFDLSYLLYCTQGVKLVMGGYRRYLTDGSGKNYMRLVANAGYEYDTYLAIQNVEGLNSGIWHYLPVTHQLAFISEKKDLPEELDRTFTNPSQNQSYVKKAAVVFFWVCVPYRSEWIQGEAGHKLMLMDVGYISHQLYLAAETIHCGCCAIAGYHQEIADELLGIDGNEKYTVLCSSIGHKGLGQW